MQPLLNSDQICEYLQISYNRFLRYTREDPTFPARKAGGTWKADPDELRAWFQAQPNGTAASREEHGASQNLVQIAPRRKRGRPPVRLAAPAGGWQVRIPE